VFESIVVVLERLTRVERWVDVGQLDLAQVLVPELGDGGQRGQRVQRVATDEQVVAGAFMVGGDLAHRGHVVQQPDLGHPVVARRRPLVRAVLVGEQSLVLIRPGQF
jgi:hypothetical protein